MNAFTTVWTNHPLVLINEICREKKITRFTLDDADDLETVCKAFAKVVLDQVEVEMNALIEKIEQLQDPEER